MTKKHGMAAMALAAAMYAGPALLQANQSETAAQQTKSECQMLLERYRATMDRVEQAQKELERLAANMRTAQTQEARLDAMQNVVAELVQQRGQAIEQVEQINASRIARMMAHSPIGSASCDMLIPLPIN